VTPRRIVEALGRVREARRTPAEASP
jgi:hypothetical protein